MYSTTLSFLCSSQPRITMSFSILLHGLSDPEQIHGNVRTVVEGLCFSHYDWSAPFRQSLHKYFSILVLIYKTPQQIMCFVSYFIVIAPKLQSHCSLFLWAFLKLFLKNTYTSFINIKMQVLFMLDFWKNFTICLWSLVVTIIEGDMQPQWPLGRWHK